MGVDFGDLHDDEPGAEPKPFPTPEEQRQAAAAREVKLAEERVERREKMGQQARPEPALGDSED